MALPLGVAEVELRGADGQAFPAEICRRQITLAGGGDEFAILAPSIVEPSEAMSLAERLLDILKESVRLNNVEVMINASIGIALFPADGDTIEDLLRNADTAMYIAKADGRATSRFFDLRRPD
ncbi:MAG: GGDEF domain-containing protein [Burkholderiaceae bacterium]